VVRAAGPESTVPWAADTNRLKNASVNSPAARSALLPFIDRNSPRWQPGTSIRTLRKPSDPPSSVIIQHSRSESYNPQFSVSDELQRQGVFDGLPQSVAGIGRSSSRAH
jgi:hypothetical protein